MENATLTGLVSTQSGTLLMSVCANREATPRRSFVTAFQSETCVWAFGPATVEVRLGSRPSSSRRVGCQPFRCRLSVLQPTLTHSGTWQVWNDWWRWAKSAISARHEFRAVHTLIQGTSRIDIWRDQVVVENTRMKPIYLLEAVGSALPVSFPETGSWESEETDTWVEFDWLAESLTDLGRLNRYWRNFFMRPPFFFDFFVVIDEVWSAMEMRAG